MRKGLLKVLSRKPVVPCLAGCFLYPWALIRPVIVLLGLTVAQDLCARPGNTLKYPFIQCCIPSCHSLEQPILPCIPFLSLNLKGLLLPSHWSGFYFYTLVSLMSTENSGHILFVQADLCKGNSFIHLFIFAPIHSNILALLWELATHHSHQIKMTTARCSAFIPTQDQAALPQPPGASLADDSLLSVLSGICLH